MTQIASSKEKNKAWYWKYVVVLTDGYAHCCCTDICSGKWKMSSRPGNNIDKHIRKSRPDLVPGSTAKSLENGKIDDQEENTLIDNFISFPPPLSICQICDRPYSSSNQLRIHQMKKHPKFWEKRKIIDKRITPRMEIERGDFPELIYDADEKKYTCKVCGKQDWRPDKGGLEK